MKLTLTDSMKWIKESGAGMDEGRDGLNPLETTDCMKSICSRNISKFIICLPCGLHLGYVCSWHSQQIHFPIPTGHITSSNQPDSQQGRWANTRKSHPLITSNPPLSTTNNTLVYPQITRTMTIMKQHSFPSNLTVSTVHVISIK